MKSHFKIIIVTLGLFAGAEFVSAAQTAVAPPAPTQTKGVPAPTPYAVISRDANSRVWQRTVYEKSPSGGIVTNTHSYTELATGLHYWSNGQWADSQEVINILPDGTAAAINGQHQAYFPGDIYNGVIRMVTPDGMVLQSRPVGLSYDDGTNTVMIAELTNSIGYLVGSNQVVYPNAFTGFKADLRYIYTKSRFEQDVVLRQQPPTPESLGLNADTARLQVLTEFFSPPQPASHSSTLPVQAGLALADHSLGFGKMQMVQGRAFLMGRNATNAGAFVAKQWLRLNGRQFLVEEVPVDAIVDGLAALPLTAISSGSGKATHIASRQRELPPQRLIKNTSETVMLASVESPTQGLVLDYVATVMYQYNYTFQGDTTYYISGMCNSYATNTFEGGAVLKFATNGSIVISSGIFSPAINWQAGAYRPVVFTAVDDNSVGEAISGSTGSPSGYYGNPMLNLTSFSQPQTVSGLRVAYAQKAIGCYFISLTCNNLQFVNCQIGLDLESATVQLGNALFANTSTGFNFQGSSMVAAQNITVDGATTVAQGSSSYAGNFLALTNCLVSNDIYLTNGVVGLNASYNGFYNSPTFGANQVTNTFNPFQTVGGGAYYLTNGCSFVDAGTTNMDPAVLADLVTKTTCPPIVYSNVTITTNLTLAPQSLRDTNSSPDLGYHYDPIDYFTEMCAVFNATLNIAAGTVIACDNATGILLQNGSAINSVGTALSPNWFTYYLSVQEEPISLGVYGSFEYALNVSPDQLTSINPNGVYQFTKFSRPAGGGYQICNTYPTTYSNLLVSSCEVWNGINELTGPGNPWGVVQPPSSAKIENTLFVRATINAYDGAWMVPPNYSLSLSNNLIWGSSSVAIDETRPVPWSVFNNVFDTCVINAYTWITNGFNGYLNCSGSGRFYPDNGNDIVTNISIIYQTGPLGTFYQPTNSPLIDKGSTTANVEGLSNFTTQTNQTQEGNSIVDIGYHYMALDRYGYLVISSDGSGMSDGWELANFGHTGVDPNADPDGDGLTNLQEYQAGTNPNIDDSTVTASRLNYIYDAGGWLKTVSGKHSGVINPDSEGNIQTVSQ